MRNRRKFWLLLIAVLSVAVFLFGTVFTGCKGEPAEETTAVETKAEETKTEETAEEEEAEEEEAVEEPAEEVEPVVWKLGSGNAADNIECIEIAEYMVPKIEEATQGRVKIEFYPGATLGGDKEVIEMVRAGTIAGQMQGLAFYQAYMEEIQGLLFPYTFEKQEMMTDYINEVIIPEILDDPELIEECGFVCIAATNFGPRHLTTKGILATDPSFMNGKKIRAMEQPVSMSYSYALGGVPVPIAYSELYMALQTGVADAQENPIANIITMKFYEVQDVLVETGHICAIDLFTFNKDVWISISEEDQNIISEIIKETAYSASAKFKEQEEELLRQLAEDHGMTILRRDDIDIQAFIDNAVKVVEEQFGEPEYVKWREVNDAAKKWCEENASRY